MVEWIAKENLELPCVDLLIFDHRNGLAILFKETHSIRIHRNDPVKLFIKNGEEVREVDPAEWMESLLEDKK